MKRGLFELTMDRTFDFSLETAATIPSDSTKLYGTFNLRIV